MKKQKKIKKGGGEKREKSLQSRVFDILWKIKLLKCKKIKTGGKLQKKKKKRRKKDLIWFRRTRFYPLSSQNRKGIKEGRNQIRAMEGGGSAEPFCVQMRSSSAAASGRSGRCKTTFHLHTKRYCSPQ